MADEKKAAPTAKPEVDPDNITLSAEDLARIERKARETVAAERKKALEEMALKEALEKIRGKEGMRTGDPVEDEIVLLTINLPAGAVGRSHNGNELNGIRINGREYTHGKTYEVPRHVARSLMEIMFRCEVHEHSLTDKPMSEFYRKPRHTLLTRRGAVNAPRPPGEGTPAAGAV